jgi:hypothetical protein
MSILLKLLVAACFAAMMTSCCCLGDGGLDKDRTDDGELVRPEHSEGIGNGL